jgi:hypothetical protein
MHIFELKRRLDLFLAEQPVERFKASGSSAAGFRVELALKPNTPITERFLQRLETALRREIGSLSVLRIRRNVFIIRFKLKPADDDISAADRVEELPACYAMLAKAYNGRAKISAHCSLRPSVSPSPCAGFEPCPSVTLS